MATCPMSAGNSNALASLMSDNPRYKELFDLNSQPANTGVDMGKDYTEDMNRLRDAGAVQKGSLRELLGVAEVDHNTVKRENYTFFSYRACEIGFRENLVFSSEGYNESPGVRSVGKTILSMVGKEHKRLRSAAQPLFKRPKVLDWWNKRWIEETVDALLDRMLDREAVDLNMELCAVCRWPRSPAPSGWRARTSSSFAINWTGRPLARPALVKKRQRNRGPSLTRHCAT